MKKLVLLLIGLVALILLHYSTGLFTRYNFLTAQFDILTNNIKIINYGEKEKTDSLAACLAPSLGFNYVTYGCTLRKDQINGIAAYNRVMMSYLDKKLGSDWYFDFETKCDLIYNTALINQGSTTMDCNFINASLPQVSEQVKHHGIDMVATTRQISNYNYRIKYIGGLLNSITYNTDSPPSLKYEIHWYNQRRYHIPKPKDICIFVDTTQVISTHSGEYGDNKYYNAFAVFIYNKSGDSLDIGDAHSINLYMEALDDKGNWMSIEELMPPMTGGQFLFLPPNEIALTTAIRYKGSFKTKIRLRYENIFSNEFSGSINPIQFQALEEFK